MSDLIRWIASALAPGPFRISSRLQLSRCPDCRASTLRGLDDEEAGTLVRVTPRALSPLGEALALMTDPNDRTYLLVKTGKGARLVPRDRWSIAGDPAGTQKWPVVARHVCGWKLPADPRRFESPRLTIPDEPPF